MLLGLLTALLLAPVYWLVVPVAWRREVLSIASLVALGLYDARLVPLLLAITAALFGLMWAIRVLPQGAGRLLATAAGLAGLAALFLWNKLGGSANSALPSQTGLVFLGVSYLVIKAAGALVDTARATTGGVRFRELLAWITFLPTYPSGPMETLDHFRSQWPARDRARALGGLERILFGLVKALVCAHYLGVWASPMLAAPEKYSPLFLLAGLYALSLRFYFDFSGYSDIAIGLGAIFGYDIEENFDRPFLRRNLAQLWQHWHITLTRWLRTYLFIPVSRRILRLGGGRFDRSAIAAGQIVAMTFCGLWHGVGWNFALWGFLQGLGLIWVGVLSRDVSRRLPPGLVRWWRQSRIAYALSTALTFNAFAILIAFIATDLEGALRYLRLLITL